jgi:hypothetical protein
MTRALTVVCLTLCAALLGACGGDDEGPTADELLRETLATPATAIDSGAMNLSFQLDPEGLLAVGGPIRFTLDGPFAAPRAGELPRFGVDFGALLGGEDYGARLLSTGTRAYMTLDDVPYRVDDAFVTRLRDGIDAPSGRSRGGLRALGVDPLRWISAARTRGTERVSATDTTRITGKLNVARVLADFDRLLTKAGGSARGPSLLEPGLRQQIAGAVNSASVDIWTGTSDKLLRQFAVKIEFFFALGESPVQGLNGGTINLRVRLDDVNKTPAAIDPPKHPRPLADLTGGGAANILRGIQAGLTGGEARGLFGCITGAAGSSAALVRCIATLAP